MEGLCLKQRPDVGLVPSNSLCDVMFLCMYVDKLFVKICDNISGISSKFEIMYLVNNCIYLERAYLF